MTGASSFVAGGAPFLKTPLKEGRRTSRGPEPRPIPRSMVLLTFSPREPLPRHGHVGLRVHHRALAPSMLAPVGDHLAEALEAEDQHQRREPERRAQRPPCAICWPTENAVTSELPAKIVSSSACCTPSAAGREREHGRDDLHGEHEQRVAHRPADVERVEQSPVGREPEDPAGELPAWPSRGGSAGGRAGSRSPGAGAARTPARAPTGTQTRAGSRSPAP